MATSSKALLIAGLYATAACEGAALAQIELGVQIGWKAVEENERCLQGEPLSEKYLGEPDGPAQALMVRYWTAAKESDLAKLRSFTRSLGRSGFVLNGTPTRIDKSAAGGINDPYAKTPGNVLLEMPIAFVRSGRGNRARGLWEVKSSTGLRAGLYLADFSGNIFSWRLTRLELIPAIEPPPMIEPYCDKPGDIEEYAALQDKWEAERQAKQEQRKTRAK